MQNHRKKVFYDHTPLESIPPGEEWTTEYESNSRKLVDYLDSNGAGSTLYSTTIRCLTRLYEYLKQEHISYSPSAAMNWCHTISDLPKTYLITVNRLSDLYESGKIQLLHRFPVSKPYYAGLDGIYKEQADLYIESLCDTYKPNHLAGIRRKVSKFLYKVQTAGIVQPCDITIGFIDEYITNDAHSSVIASNEYAYSVTDIMVFMAGQGLCRYGTAWYACVKTCGRIHDINDYTDGQRLMMESLREASQEFPSEEFAVLIPDFLDHLSDLGYSKSHRSVAKSSLYNFLIFLEINNLGYHYGIACVWLEHEKNFFATDSWKSVRRFLDLFNEYTEIGDVSAGHCFTHRPLKSDLLPDWCKSRLNEFLVLKKKEGFRKSTITMYRSAVTRFCEFLVSEGLSDFSEITCQLIKEFNQKDPHRTADGKNAYNVRIRKFLGFLEKGDVIPYGTSLALSCIAASHEENVVTLSDNEKDTISEKLKDPESPIELRNKVILLLGTEMGIRSIDIVKINLEDIDWEKQSIRLIQTKTDHEIELPMPTSVGNAIYTYIRKGRHETRSHALIINTRAPYDRVTRVVCRKALEDVLPERDTDGSGFHVTRKTFATEMLRKNASKTHVADLLGHRDETSLVHYLNLDSEKMSLCPISLKESGLEMEVSRYD